MSTPGVRPMMAMRCPEAMLAGLPNAICPSTVRPFGPGACACGAATSASISEGMAMVRRSRPDTWLGRSGTWLGRPEGIAGTWLGRRTALRRGRREHPGGGAGVMRSPRRRSPIAWVGAFGRPKSRGGSFGGTNAGDDARGRCCPAARRRPRAAVEAAGPGGGGAERRATSAAVNTATSVTGTHCEDPAGQTAWSPVTCPAAIHWSMAGVG